MQDFGGGFGLGAYLLQFVCQIREVLDFLHGLHILLRIGFEDFQVVLELRQGHVLEFLRELTTLGLHLLHARETHVAFDGVHLDFDHVFDALERLRGGGGPVEVGRENFGRGIRLGVRQVGDVHLRCPGADAELLHVGSLECVLGVSLEDAAIHLLAVLDVDGLHIGIDLAHRAQVEVHARGAAAGRVAVGAPLHIAHVIAHGGEFLCHLVDALGIDIVLKTAVEPRLGGRRLTIFELPLELVVGIGRRDELVELLVERSHLGLVACPVGFRAGGLQFLIPFDHFARLLDFVLRHGALP